MEIVEQLIHDLEKGGWRDALRGLAIHGDERAVWPIIEFYGQILDPDSRQVELTQRALLHIGEGAVDPLIRVLDSWNPALQELACEILGELKPVRAVPPLGNVMMRDINSLVAKYAAWAIGDIGGEESVDWLIKALKHPHRDIQQIAVKTLGELGNPKAIQPLIDYLNARDQELIDAVNNSLKQLGHA
jgi:HEAT repeat protein